MLAAGRIIFLHATFGFCVLLCQLFLHASVALHAMGLRWERTSTSALVVRVTMMLPIIKVTKVTKTAQFKLLRLPRLTR